MAIMLYDHPYSRAAGVIWMLEEVGLPYELRFVDILAGGQKAPKSSRCEAMSCHAYQWSNRALIWQPRGRAFPSSDRRDLQLFATHVLSCVAAAVPNVRHFSTSHSVTSFESRDLVAESKRRRTQSSSSPKIPARNAPVTLATFNDTCANLIQMHHAM